MLCAVPACKRRGAVPAAADSKQVGLGCPRPQGRRQQQQQQAGWLVPRGQARPTLSGAAACRWGGCRDGCVGGGGGRRVAHVGQGGVRGGGGVQHAWLRLGGWCGLQEAVCRFPGAVDAGQGWSMLVCLVVVWGVWFHAPLVWRLAAQSFKAVVCVFVGPRPASTALCCWRQAGGR